MGFDPDMSLKFDGDIMRLSRLSWHTTNDAMMWFKNIGCNVAALALYWYNYIYIYDMYIYIYIHNKHYLIPTIDVVQPMPWRIH